MGRGHAPRGWAHYVWDLRVTDARNRILSSVADPQAAAWQVSSPPPGVVHVEYEVDLAFTRTDWPYGNEQAGLWQGGALFLVSKALFITSDAPGPRRVRIDAPATWSVSTPWPPVEDDPRHVTVADRDALLDNSLVVGRYAEHVVQAGRIRFVLALLGTAAESGAEVAGALRPIVGDFGSVFPTTAPTQFLMTIFPAREGDAEAFQASAAFSETEALTADTRPRWANYDGGWAVAFSLDVQARAAGGPTLDDAMRLLYERFGREKRKYTYEELVATLGEGLGQDLRPFFARYVEGDEILPLQETLRAAGYLALTKPHDGEVYLRREPHPSARTDAIRRGLLGRP